MNYEESIKAVLVGVRHGTLAPAALDAVIENLSMRSRVFWSGQHDAKGTGPIGDGTPHARMVWFWDRMEKHSDLISELTGYALVNSKYRFEAAVADAFDRLAEERARA